MSRLFLVIYARIYSIHYSALLTQVEVLLSKSISKNKGERRTFDPTDSFGSSQLWSNKAKASVPTDEHGKAISVAHSSGVQSVAIGTLDVPEETKKEPPTLVAPTAVCRLWCPWSATFCPRESVQWTTTERFLLYATAHFQKHRGISPRYFPLYLKEPEFRFNHRQDDLFSLFVRLLCQASLVRLQHLAPMLSHSLTARDGRLFLSCFCQFCPLRKAFPRTFFTLL